MRRRIVQPTYLYVSNDPPKPPSDPNPIVEYRIFTVPFGKGRNMCANDCNRVFVVNAIIFVVHQILVDYNKYLLQKNPYEVC
jgi:hypothetical protein